MAYQVILEPDIGQFRWFEPRRVHTRMNWCAQIDLREARERELPTLDKKLTSSGIAKLYARLKSKARTGGEEGTTPVTTACPECWKVEM